MLIKTPRKHSRRVLFLAVMGLLVLPEAQAADDGGGPAGTVKLAWDLSWEPDIAGYRVHYGPESGNYTEIVDVGYQVKAELTNLPVGNTYFCAVTAYNTYGLESDYSNEITFTVKAPEAVLDSDSDLLSDLFEATWGDGADMDPAADLDGDGLTALVEFAHGLNPLRAHDRPRSQLETIQIDDARYLSIRYLYDPLSERHVSIHVERTLNFADPESWQRGQTATVSTTISQEYPGLLEIVARSLSPITAQTTEYLRFRYEATSP